MTERSYELLTRSDLLCLSRIAEADRSDLFRRKLETGRLYSKRLFAVALCQGAALHYIGGKNGIKDFDVWSFFRAHPERQFPYRRNATADFGDPKFGTTDGYSHFVGRRVDLIGRSIAADDFSDPVAVLRAYLRGRHTESARQLAGKAMVLIYPSRLLGTVVWPIGGSYTRNGCPA